MGSMFRLVVVAAIHSFLLLVQAQNTSLPGVSTFNVPPGFPTSIFSSYWVPPSPTQEPQPVIYDDVLKVTFPFNLSNPNSIPTSPNDRIFFPAPIGYYSNASAEAFVQSALRQIHGIIDESNISGNCSKCIAALSIGKLVAQVAPKHLPSAMIKLCQANRFASNATCEVNYAASNFGSIWTQVLALADVEGQDGLYICNSISTTFCKMPNANALNITSYISKPKPANAVAPASNGKRIKVLHLSDIHLDARYFVGAEANCSAGMCCRTNLKNAASANGSIFAPAAVWGDFKCDSPYGLVTAALQSIGPLTGVSGNETFGWTIYTGDLVPHDAANQRSHAWIQYAEASVYSMMKSYLKAPVFPVLGNHETSPVSVDAPHALPGQLGSQYSWSYNHVSALWQHEGWIDAKTAAQARIHYGAYSVLNHYGLRIITLNTDFWYKSNPLNFINTTNPDVSGMLKFLISELQSAEDSGERVWILGHVLSGWDGTNPLPNPTNLFYQIVERFSPHVVSTVMFGHTHEDQNFIFYANNGTVQSADTAINAAWLGPSITPLTNLNSGYRMYEIDSHSFQVLDAYTFFANVSSFSALNSSSGPTFEFEYSTRETYGPAANWPDDAPLNATFWHRVTEAMERDQTLVQVYNTFQGKSSVRSPNCTSTACAKAKICYMRSGSVPLGKQCPQGFGSVQSPYTGSN